MPYNVYLKKNEDKRIRQGYPWVYANEVSKIEGKGKNGDIACVFDCDNNYLVIIRIILGANDHGIAVFDARLHAVAFDL